MNATIWKRVRVLVMLLLGGVAVFLVHKRFQEHRPLPPPAAPIASGPLAGLGLEPAFPQLTFKRPVFVTFAPGDAKHAYVVEQIGVVKRFEARADVTETETVLDLRRQVSTAGNEEGLLGFAFHPSFPRDRRIFVYYSASEGGPLLGGRSIVSSFTVDERGVADPQSEQLLLEVEQPYRNHNGGMIAFGPKGKLFIGLGDGGLAGDPDDNGLRSETLLGAILRIDVDAEGKPYGIPADNPLREVEGARPEIYAYGFRNPWRFSFDRKTGELWTGDVGQNAWEEVHLVVPGGNHGWRAYEGFSVYSEGDLSRAKDPVEPLAAYGRGEGVSITGGYVYRGTKLPALVGHYVYADYQTGAVWALRHGGSEGADLDDRSHRTAKGVEVTKLFDSELMIASFGETPDGELLVCAFDGRIHVLR